MHEDSRIALLLAGNGFIGRRVALTLASRGFRVAVHHAGRHPFPSASGIDSIAVNPTPLPIVSFPRATRAMRPDVVVHFLCMGNDDADAFTSVFDGRARRLVLISSCDVYRAYARFIGTEPGRPDPTPLDESAPVRERLFPYRSEAPHPSQLEYWYDKLAAERVVRHAQRSEVTILRLPKVYGSDPKHGLQSVYGFAHRPSWRWTHGHVDNVAAAIAFAASHPGAAGEIFNLGEPETPIMGERLAGLPPRTDMESLGATYDFRQLLHFATTKIRRLGYRDVVDEADAMRRTRGA